MWALQISLDATEGSSTSIHSNLGEMMGESIIEEACELAKTANSSTELEWEEEDN
jgi:hypothetical protein